MSKLTLRQWRRLRNMSQKELADHVGVTDETIRKYETEGIDSARYETVTNLLNVLNIKLEDISFEGEETI